MGGVNFDKVEGDDPVGDFDTRTLQDSGRVSVPSEYLKVLGLERGDKVVVVCKEDSVVVKDAREVLLDDS